MKHKSIILGFAVIIASLLSTVSAGNDGKNMKTRFTEYVNAVNQRQFGDDATWRKPANRNTGVVSLADKKSAMLKAAPKTDGYFGPASYWGSLFTPAGEEWLYSAEYTVSNITAWQSSITAAAITVYDADFNVVATLDIPLELGENETSINSVQVTPTLSKKFFNINDAYELMIYVHATTVDYSGSEYTLVYTLSDGSLVTRIEGNNISAVNTAADPWSENFTMTFMRESVSEDYEYTLSFDVYSKAGWSNGAKLEHTFDVDFANIAGAGNYALPILINQSRGNMFYALPRYEKPFFVSDWSEEITPDNNFIIDLYDSKFNLVKTTKIPMQTEAEALFSFPGIGELFGNADLDFTLFGNSAEPCYIIGYENYINNVDEFVTSLYVYDTDGNRLGSIVENASDYMTMSDVKDSEKQICILNIDGDYNSYFSFIDLPSNTEAARIDVYQDNTTLSTAIDRIANADSYCYVASLAQANIDDQNNVIHRIAWFNADGSPLRTDNINLGNKTVMAQVYIGSDALDPYLFNTDSDMEYMFLVKEQPSTESTRTNEYLRIYNTKSDILLNLGPDEDTGKALNSIFLLNPNTEKTKLVVSYYGDDAYTVHHIDLPLNMFAGGDGTLDSPYLIACPADLMAVYKSPAANYLITADLDFSGTEWKAYNVAFTGTIDGDGHSVSNLTLNETAMFTEVAETAVIKNIAFKNVTINHNTYNSVGVVAGYAVGNSAAGPLFSNISIDNITVNGTGSGDFGSIAGTTALFTNIADCSVTGASINLPEAYAGGIAGNIGTASKISNCLFKGSVTAEVAGGIAANSKRGDESVANCHVAADIKGKNAGGVIGESARTAISHCYVEGSVTAVAEKGRACAGGINGVLDADYEDEAVVIISNNIVAAKVSASANDADKAYAHRICGYSSGDERLVNWESTDPSVNWEDPTTWPYIDGKPEKGLAFNYAVGLQPVSADVADSADSTEGLSIDAIDTKLLSQGEWLLGTDKDNPWKFESGLLVLYFEDALSTGITDITSDTLCKITLQGSQVVCDGHRITVYDLSGRVVASGHSSVSVSQLTAGVYVAVAGNVSLKFSI